jgi:DNA-binding protein HU-beta
MRKADIVQIISDKTGIAKVDVLVILETYFIEVKETVLTGEAVSVSTFGTFMLKKRAAKIGRNVMQNIEIPIPAHYIPYFKPSKEFMEALKSIPIKK